jgi:hypothetical protein
MHLRPAIFSTLVCLASAAPAWPLDRNADDSKGDIPREASISLVHEPESPRGVLLPGGPPDDTRHNGTR